MKLLIGNTTMESLTYEQFQLSRKANISLMESTMLPEFEREAYVNMLLKDLKQEVEALTKATSTTRI